MMKRYLGLLALAPGGLALAQEAAAQPATKTGGVPWWVWLIIVVVVILLGYYLYKRRGKKE
jgi:LPXTG-motif cell wall-anchored protein